MSIITRDITEFPAGVIDEIASRLDEESLLRFGATCRYVRHILLTTSRHWSGRTVFAIERPLRGMSFRHYISERRGNQQLATQLRKVHSSSVNSLIAGRNFFASGSSDGSICIWNLKGEPIRRLQAHQGAVTSLAVSDQLILSGSWDCSLCFWNVYAGSLLHRIPGQPPINRVVLSHRFFAAGCHDGSLHVFNMGTKASLYTIAADQLPVTSLATHSSLILSGHTDGSIRVRDFHTGDLLFQIKSDLGPVTLLEASDEGILSGFSGTICHWNYQGRRTLCSRGHPASALYVSNDPHRNFAAGSWNSAVRIWNPENGRLFYSLPGPATVCSLLYFNQNPQGARFIVAGFSNGTVGMWKLEPEKILQPKLSIRERFKMGSKLFG